MRFGMMVRFVLNSASMFGQPGLPLIMAAAAASGAAAASRAVRNLVADRDVFLRTSVIGPLSSPWWEEQWYFCCGCGTNVSGNHLWMDAAAETMQCSGKRKTAFNKWIKWKSPEEKFSQALSHVKDEPGRQFLHDMFDDVNFDPKLQAIWQRCVATHDAAHQDAVAPFTAHTAANPLPPLLPPPLQPGPHGRLTNEEPPYMSRIAGVQGEIDDLRRFVAELEQTVIVLSSRLEQAIYSPATARWDRWGDVRDADPGPCPWDSWAPALPAAAGRPFVPGPPGDWCPNEPSIVRPSLCRSKPEEF